MILKAGTYKWNNTLINSYNELGNLTQDIELISNVSVSQIGYTGVATISKITIGPPLVENETGGYDLDVNSLIVNVTVTNLNPETPYVETPTIPTIYSNGWKVDMWGDNIREFTIPYDQEVDNIVGAYFIANTNYNEVNKSSLATITYNGQVIASLNAGETATLSCNGKKMVSDVVVKIGSGGASAYTVTSVDELPSNAVDGSLAVVENDDIIGRWVLNTTPNLPQTEVDWYFDFEFTDANGANKKVYNVYSNDGESISELYYCLEDDTELTAYLLDIPPFGWVTLEYRYLNITSTPNAEAEAWIRANGQKTKSLYTRENGEWVYKCEVV